MQRNLSIRTFYAVVIICNSLALSLLPTLSAHTAEVDVHVVDPEGIRTVKPVHRLGQRQRRQTGHDPTGFTIKMRMNGIVPARHLVKIHTLIRRQLTDDPVLLEGGQNPVDRHFVDLLLGIRPVQDLCGTQRSVRLYDDFQYGHPLGRLIQAGVPQGFRRITVFVCLGNVFLYIKCNLIANYFISCYSNISLHDA
jgi:hypothetical protein